jgi:hypothetical protein
VLKQSNLNASQRKNILLKFIPLYLLNILRIFKKLIGTPSKKALGKKRKEIGKSGKTFPL